MLLSLLGGQIDVNKSKTLLKYRSICLKDYDSL